MHALPPASLLVAALVMLRHPCPRNTATARMLLERAARHDALSTIEQETCHTLADDLDRDITRMAVTRRTRMPPSRATMPSPDLDSSPCLKEAC